MTDKGKPGCYDEVVQMEDSIKWELAMKDEMDSLMTDQTCQLVGY